MAEYAVEFWTLAVVARWNESLLLGVFGQGLNQQLQGALALRGEPKYLDTLISLAIELDNHLGGQCREQSVLMKAPSPLPSSLFHPASSGSVQPSSSAPSAVSLSGSEPMQVGGARLTPSERWRRLGSKVCLYCGQSDHYLLLSPIFLEFVSAVSRIRTQLSGLSRFRSVALHGFSWLSASSVRFSGRRGGGSIHAANLRRCRSVWRQVCSTLMRSSLQSQRQANRVPAPCYRAGQKVWLSSKGPTPGRV